MYQNRIYWDENLVWHSPIWLSWTNQHLNLNIFFFFFCFIGWDGTASDQPNSRATILYLKCPLKHPWIIIVLHILIVNLKGVADMKAVYRRPNILSYIFIDFFSSEFLLDIFLYGLLILKQRYAKSRPDGPTRKASWFHWPRDS